MKNTAAILLAALCCMLLCSCGGLYAKETAEETEVTVTEWDGPPPQSILNTDFRSIVWGMNDYEVSRQEQRSADGFGDYYLYFDGIGFAGFDSRLYYYFDDNWKCTSAAYMISLSPNVPSYDAAYDRVDNFLTELFVPPDEEGGNIRTTSTAVIELIQRETDIEQTICVRFSMPEGYENKKSSSKIIYFEDGVPILTRYILYFP
ncbi:MAG: hypothetical protein ACI4K7_04330 [Oscillospiraceae bacterium]